jgi:hypothetical protein
MRILLSLGTKSGSAAENASWTVSNTAGGGRPAACGNRTLGDLRDSFAGRQGSALADRPE